MEIIKKYRILIFILLCWTGILFFVGAFSENLSTYQDKKCTVNSYSPYYRWDSSWYTRIAKRGYNFSAEKNSSIAYWPLYPLALKASVATNLIDYEKVSTTLSVIFTFLTAYFIFLLARFDYSTKISTRIVLALLFFPASYFFIAGYPESLFTFLAVLSFYFARKQKWALAGIVAALLALTKPYGVLIIPALLFEYIFVNGGNIRILFQKSSWIPLLLPIGSVLGFMLFNYIKFNNAIAFLVTQQTWGRKVGNPLAALFWEAKDYITPPEKLLTGTGFPYIIYFCSLIFFIWAIYISWNRVRKSYLIFTLLVMVVAFMTGTLTSWDRYMLTSFASIMGPIVFFSEKKTRYIAIYAIISFSLFVFMASLFVRCYPVE